MQACFAAPCIPGTVSIDSAHRFVTLRATFPAGTDRLDLDDFYGYRRSKLWHSPDGSARATDNAIVLTNPHHRTAILRMDVRHNIARPDRAYRPFLRFGDDSIAVYSGNFAAKEGGSGLCLRYAAAPGQKVIGYGEISATAIRAPQRSGYVVFGRPRVLDAGGLIVVTDRAAPAWIVQFMTTTIPAIDRYYTRALWPVAKPIIVLWTAPALEGFNGDHLDASLTLGIFGAKWNHPDESAEYTLLHFLGHELFHDWNAGGSFRMTAHVGLLAREGGADAASAIASAAVAGVPVNEAWLHGVNDAYNACLAELPDRESLGVRLQQPSPNKLPYDCGQVVMFALAASAPAHDPATTYFAMWRRLHARASSRAYTWRDLAPQDADRAAVHALGRAIDRPGAFAKASAVAFAADGYEMQPEPHPNVSERTAAAKALMAWAMGEDCGGRVSFWTQPDGFLVDASVRQCKSLRVGGTVVGMLGQNLRDDPWRLADQVRQHCARHEPITVEYGEWAASTDLTCRTPPQSLTRPLRIVPAGKAERGHPATPVSQQR